MPRRDYKALRDSLIEADKQKLADIFSEQQTIARDIINQNIRRDQEHLRLINFCAEPFLYNGRLHSETEYLLIAIEPLYGMSVKNFDIGIFNPSTKVMILVECKSSVSDAGKEVHELLQAAEAAEANRKELDTLVGDTVKIKETVLCTNAAYSQRFKDAIRAENLPIIVWSADQGIDILLLEKQGDDVVAEISAGRVHREEKLRRLLFQGVKSQGMVRSISFLPSSHPCTILEEIVPLLLLKMLGHDSFRLSDLRNQLANESYFANFSDKDVWRLSESILKNALETEIFRAHSSPTDDLSRMDFEIAIRKVSIKEIRKRYCDYHSKRIAEERSVEEYEKAISKTYKKLTDFESG